MAKMNWNNFEKNAKGIKKNIKNLKAAGEYLKEIPSEGYMSEYKLVSKETETGEKIKERQKVVSLIKDCKSSTLRRYIKSLDNFYYLVTSQTDRDTILKKKIEIEKELNSRNDGIIEK